MRADGQDGGQGKKNPVSAGRGRSVDRKQVEEIVERYEHKKDAEHVGAHGDRDFDGGYRQAESYSGSSPRTRPHPEFPARSASESPPLMETTEVLLAYGLGISLSE